MRREAWSDYRWLSMFVEAADRLPGTPGGRTAEQVARNVIEVQIGIVDDARRALGEIDRLRVEIERLEVRNESQRVALDRVAAIADRFLRGERWERGRSAGGG